MNLNLNIVNCRLLLVFIFTITSYDSWAQISLDEYRGQVVEYSHELRIAQSRVTSAEEGIKLSFTEFLPELSMSADFDLTFKNNNNTRSWMWAIRPEIRQQLYRGGGVRAGYKRSQIAHNIALFDEQMAMLDIIYAADYAYWSLSRAEMYREAVSNYYDIIKSLREVVAQRYNEGYISKSDLLQVESRMSDAEYQLSSAHQEYLVVLHNFNILRGEASDVQVDIASEVLQHPPMPERCNIEDLLLVHPQYRNALSSVESAKWAIREVRSQYMPSLSAGVYGGWQPSMPHIKGGGTTLDGGVVVGLSVPIFHFGERRRAVSISCGDYEREQLRAMDIRDRLILLESNCWTDLVNSRSRLDAAQRNLDIAKENLDISTYSYGEGMTTILDVLQAQISWLQIYTNTITAQYDYAVAVSKYLQITATRP